MNNTSTKESTRNVPWVEGEAFIAWTTASLTAQTASPHVTVKAVSGRSLQNHGWSWLSEAVTTRALLHSLYPLSGCLECFVTRVRNLKVLKNTFQPNFLKWDVVVFSPSSLFTSDEAKALPQHESSFFLLTSSIKCVSLSLIIEPPESRTAVPLLCGTHIHDRCNAFSEKVS